MPKMSKEKLFGINSDEIGKIGISLQEKSPERGWGRIELKNAIFEALVLKYNLPWDESRCGFPDWDDYLVQKLFDEFKSCYENTNIPELLDGIEARCEEEEYCDWSDTGQTLLKELTVFF